MKIFAKLKNYSIKKKLVLLSVSISAVGLFLSATTFMVFDYIQVKDSIFAGASKAGPYHLKEYRRTACV